MKKVLFVMPQLGGGGAERVVSTLLSNLNREKFEIELVLLNKAGDYLQDLPKEIPIIRLYKKNKARKIAELIKLIRSKKPDIIFSSMRTTSSILGFLKFLYPSNTKLVFRENNTPSVSIKDSRFPWLWKIIYKTIFKRAAVIVCQSDYMIQDFKEEFHFSGENLIKIYNPVDYESIIKKSNEGRSPFPKGSKKNIVSIGKLTNQKGFDLLIKSFAKDKMKTSDMELWILGEGPLLEEYKNLAESLNIDDRIHFVGRQQNPYIWMKHADLLILSSRYEGLPNVILEAIACNCSIITSNHPGGTNEIMSIINCSNRVVESLDWSESWFEEMKIDNNQFNNYFNASNIIRKYEKLFIEV